MDRYKQAVNEGASLDEILDVLQLQQTLEEGKINFH